MAFIMFPIILKELVVVNMLSLLLQETLLLTLVMLIKTLIFLL